MKAEDLKLVVKEKYGAIAKQSLLLNQSSCCGTSGCCGDLEISMIGSEYQNSLKIYKSKGLLLNLLLT